MIRLPALSAAALFLALSAPAWAADPLTDAIQAAYPPYRAALSLTNGKDQAEAAAALAQARQAWADLQARHARNVPVPYQRDATVAATMADVAAVYDKAAGQVQAGNLTAAHNTLEQVRDLLAALRQRNGVVVYSDHMNAFHEVMEHVVVDGPKQLADAPGALALLAQVGALDHLTHRLRSQASPALLGDADFTALLGKVEESVAALKQALLKQDLPAARDAVTKVKGPYSRLFRKYG